ncbi:ABC transporter permease [Gordonia sinesedis]
MTAATTVATAPPPAPAPPRASGVSRAYRWFRRLPMDMWFEPLVIVVLSIGYITWYNSTTLTETESAALGWSTLQGTILDHIKLTAVSTVIVVAIAIPLGILLTRPSMRWLNPIAVNIANIGQAAPAVGLLVLFTFWLGTGFRTAVIGLVVYAVLPILQNTIVGLRQVDQRTIEAARGIGLSAMRTLVQVELPLAVPVILNGVRTALVILVGTATLSTFIGATSLGTLITTGITLFLPKLLVSGAILVALLALLIDWLGRLVEYLATPKGIS